MMRATIMAITRSRCRLGAGLRTESNCSLRKQPRTAATCPCRRSREVLYATGRGVLAAGAVAGDTCGDVRPLLATVRPMGVCLFGQETRAHLVVVRSAPDVEFGRISGAVHRVADPRRRGGGVPFRTRFDM